MNFIIDYQLIVSDKPIKTGTMKVKNNSNELEAKIKLEKFLEKKHHFDRIIITKCEKDFLDIWNSMFGNKDLFK